MSYIVCRNCKNYEEVDDNQPLNFYKCTNCGHTLEFAGDNTELHFILQDVQFPKLNYNKICLNCNSTNPREAVACLHCGSSDLQFQYDFDSFDGFEGMTFGQGGENFQSDVQPRIIIKQVNVSPTSNLLFRLISLIVGLIDFFFFTMIGIQFVLGSSEVPADVFAFVSQNLYSIMIIICVSLILSGLLSILVFPRMSYGDAVKTSSTIGVIVGLSTILVSKNLLVIIVAMVFCTLFSSLGGLIGEFLIHKIFSKH